MATWSRTSPPRRSCSPRSGPPRAWCASTTSGAAAWPPAEPIPLATYALDQPADWTVRDIRLRTAGASQFTAVGPGGAHVAAGVGLAGRFNVANALAALAAAVHHGVEPQLAADAIRACPGVPGRMERVAAGQAFLALVDYAHTPDAVARAIRGDPGGRHRAGDHGPRLRRGPRPGQAPDHG